MRCARISVSLRRSPPVENVQIARRDTYAVVLFTTRADNRRQRCDCDCSLIRSHLTASACLLRQPSQISRKHAAVCLCDLLIVVATLSTLARFNSAQTLARATGHRKCATQLRRSRTATRVMCLTHICMAICSMRICVWVNRRRTQEAH